MSPTQRVYTNRFIRYALLTWLLFIPVAFLNGSIREYFYKPVLGELAAHQISCLIGSLAFFTVGYFRLRKLVSQVENKYLWVTGAVWVIMTVIFEFGIGYFSGQSSERLLHDYNVFKGRFWSFVLLAIFLTPILSKMIVEKRSK
jgi:hypothetical protein